MRQLTFSLVLFVATFAIMPIAAQQGTVTDLPVAIINLEKTEVVSKKQLDQRIAQVEIQFGIEMTAEQIKEVLDGMIDEALVLQAAAALRIDVSPQELQQAGMTYLSQLLQQQGAIPPGAVLTDPEQYKLVVEQQGMPLEEFEKNIKNQLIVEKFVTEVKRADLQAIPAATDKEIRDEYQRRIQEFARSETVWFSHIYFDTKDLPADQARRKRTEAEEVLRTIRNTPATFEEMVRKESEDDVSKAKNGYVGPMERGNPTMTQLFGTDFVEALFTVDVGKVSDVLQSNAGYHIVSISEKRDAYLMSLDDPISDGGSVQNMTVRDYLERIIYAQRQQEAFQKALEDLIRELRGRASVRYFEDHMD